VKFALDCIFTLGSDCWVCSKLGFYAVGSAGAWLRPEIATDLLCCRVCALFVASQ